MWHFTGNSVFYAYGFGFICLFVDLCVLGFIFSDHFSTAFAKSMWLNPNFSLAEPLLHYPWGRRLREEADCSRTDEGWKVTGLGPGQETAHYHPSKGKGSQSPEGTCRSQRGSRVGGLVESVVSRSWVWAQMLVVVISESKKLWSSTCWQ